MFNANTSATLTVFICSPSTSERVKQHEQERSRASNTYSLLHAPMRHLGAIGLGRGIALVTLLAKVRLDLSLALGTAIALLRHELETLGMAFERLHRALGDDGRRRRRAARHHRHGPLHSTTNQLTTEWTRIERRE